MGEHTEALYTNETHPHAGDPRVDPSARQKESVHRQTWYTLGPNTEYRFAALGSEPGSPLKGILDKATRIRVVGGKRVSNGIASFLGEFEVDGQRETGWFTYPSRKKQAPNNK